MPPPPGNKPQKRLPPTRTGRVPTTRRARRSVLRIQDRSLRDQFRAVLHAPTFGWGMFIAVLFALATGGVLAWAREQPILHAGQIARDTRLVRVPFSVVDVPATERARADARGTVPLVLVANERALEALTAPIASLPRAVEGRTSVDEVDAAIRQQFRLTPERFAAVLAVAQGQGPAPVQDIEAWEEAIARLRRELRERPVLDPKRYQQMVNETAANRAIEMRPGPNAPEEVPAIVRPPSIMVAVDAAEPLRQRMESAVREAGLEGPLAEVAVAGLVHNPRPTFSPDPHATETQQRARAEEVEPIVERYQAGERLVARGERISPTQEALAAAETRAYYEQESPAAAWTRRAVVFGAALTITGILVGYIATFVPRVARSVSRMAWLAGTVFAAVLLSCVGTVLQPQMVALTSTFPVLLLAVMLVISYDQRTSMALSLIAGLLVAIGLDQPVASIGLLLTGIGVAVWRLPEIRDRRSIIGMSAWLAGVLVAATVGFALLDRPITGPSLRQTAIDALLAGFGGLLVGMVTSAALPYIEKVFDITTGMTLIELRDPKNPLLKEMQQRAPGTYNHSLNVASIAETAADAIGANALLTYVGGLYHDIGKVNKPEYFVENQSGGVNKHDKLSPAMSLLVIVGHVKDGVEMAREYGLPRVLWHFIEAHHGTTLVEYFYHRARKQAKDGIDAKAAAEGAEPRGESDEDRLPEEVDYRYPGPRPHTKEVAILMLADAVESATRSLAEPTPSRIDALVHELANKRLMDGQFDECDLTLRELQTITSSISKTVASIYHGRIKYPAPSTKDRTRTGDTQDRKTA